MAFGRHLRRVVGDLLLRHLLPLRLLYLLLLGDPVTRVESSTVLIGWHLGLTLGIGLNTVTLQEL